MRILLLKGRFLLWTKILHSLSFTFFLRFFPNMLAWVRTWKDLPAPGSLHEPNLEIKFEHISLSLELPSLIPVTLFCFFLCFGLGFSILLYDNRHGWRSLGLANVSNYHFSSIFRLKNTEFLSEFKLSYWNKIIKSYQSNVIGFQKKVMKIWFNFKIQRPHFFLT